MFIDRSPELFEWVVHSLRTGVLQCPTHLDPSGSLFRLELEYFEIDLALGFAHRVARRKGNMAGVDVRGGALDGVVLRRSNLSGAKMGGVSLTLRTNLQRRTFERCKIVAIFG